MGFISYDWYNTGCQLSNTSDKLKPEWWPSDLNWPDSMGYGKQENPNGANYMRHYCQSQNANDCVVSNRR